MRILRTAVLTLAGGVLMAVVLFTVTTPRLGGCCSTVGDASRGWTEYVTTPGRVDPWTGEVRFETTSYTDGYGIRSTSVRDFGAEGKLPVIPLPVGFVVGSLLIMAVIRRRDATPTPPSPPRVPRIPLVGPDTLAAWRDHASGTGVQRS